MVLSKDVSIAEDTLGSTRKAWLVEYVKIPGIWVFRRLSSVIKSGIAMQWKNWEKDKVVCTAISR